MFSLNESSVALSQLSAGTMISQPEWQLDGQTHTHTGTFPQPPADFTQSLLGQTRESSRLENLQLDLCLREEQDFIHTHPKLCSDPAEDAAEDHVVFYSLQSVHEDTNVQHSVTLQKMSVTVSVVSLHVIHAVMDVIINRTDSCDESMCVLCCD